MESGVVVAILVRPLCNVHLVAGHGHRLLQLQLHFHDLMAVAVLPYPNENFGVQVIITVPFSIPPDVETGYRPLPSAAAAHRNGLILWASTLF